MDALNAIFSRRSIRKYTPATIPEQCIQTILKAAMSAPSAFDERPWHFVVLQDGKQLNDLANKIDHTEMLREAALGILICGDEKLEKIPGYWSQDCSACAQNLLLAAHALGLGAVWLAVYPLTDRMNTLRQVLGIPEDIIPFALISLGFPAEQLPPEDRYDASRVHNEKWQQGGN